jgi:hypothetical protein
MSRTRGRTPRYYLRVRTVRRDPIDYDALARAALEHAAMNQQQDQKHDGESPPKKYPRQRQQITIRTKEPGHDRLA